MKLKKCIIGLISVLCLFGCGNNSSSTNQKTDKLTFYSINDFHGTLENSLSEPGLLKMASQIRSLTTRNPNSILLSAGDMFQGSALSNLTEGNLVTEAMNSLGFDAMAIGNHEFDWGVDKIVENKELAEFPFLAANIIDKRTNKLADFAEASTIIEKGGYKIGIIGTIGSTLKTSISKDKVENYDFLPQADIVNEESKKLKEQGADVVVLLTHSTFTNFYGDEDLQKLLCEGSYTCTPSIDAIFTGHEHTYDVQRINNVPIVQAKSNGKAYGVVELTMRNGKVVSSSQDVVDFSTSGSDDQQVKEIYDQYYEELSPEINRTVGTLVGTLDRYSSYNNVSSYGQLLTDTMLNYGKSLDEDVCLSLHNTGGIRDNLYPGEVTVGDIYKTLPFDNDFLIIKTTGYYLKEVLAYYYNNYYGGVKNLESHFAFTNGDLIENDKTYSFITITFVAINSYESSPFNLYSEHFEMVYTSMLSSKLVFARDLIVEEFEKQGTIYASDYQDDR